MRGGLGRLQPVDRVHELKYPLRMAQPITVERAERVLQLPYAYRPKYDQGDRGKCVGYGLSWCMSILNRRYYDADWLFDEAQKIDEWPGEYPAYDGTSTRAGCEVLRTQGHKMLHDPRHRHEPAVVDGIVEYRWAKTVDEMRTAIMSGSPVATGIDWMSSFNTPKLIDREWWVGDVDNPGRVEGGHLICCYGASDKRQAFKWTNTWGPGYPLVWVSYRMMEKLLDGFDWPGEAAVLIDQPGASH